METTVDDDRLTVRELDAAAMRARLDELADVLVDAVAHGASVNFLAAFGPDDARAFWSTQVAGVAGGTKRLFVAEASGRIVGTVLLMFAPQPNAPHRADVGKMLVHSSMRRRGLGRRLLARVEDAALAANRTLLLLDTETGSGAETLYRECGWIEYGRVPGHSLSTAGVPADTTFFYKRLRR